MRVSPPAEPMTLDLGQLSDESLRSVAWVASRMAGRVRATGRPRPEARIWLDLAAAVDERLTQRRQTVDRMAVDIDEDGRGQVVRDGAHLDELLGAARERLREALFCQVEEEPDRGGGPKSSEDPKL